MTPKITPITIQKINQFVVTEIIIPQGSTNNIFQFKDEPRLRNVKVNKIYCFNQGEIQLYNTRLVLNTAELSFCRITIVNNNNKKILDDVPVNFLSGQFGQQDKLLFQNFEPQTLDLSKSQVYIENILGISFQTRSILFGFNIIE